MKELSDETFTLLRNQVFECMLDEVSQWSPKDIVRSGFLSIHDYTVLDMVDYLVTTENSEYWNLIHQVKLELGL
jgi:hypothetical protein